MKKYLTILLSIIFLQSQAFELLGFSFFAMSGSNTNKPLTGFFRN